MGLTTIQPADTGVEASDVGVVDACVDLSLEGGQERDDGEVLRCCERASDAHRKVRVVYERKDPQHTQFCRET